MKDGVMVDVISEIVYKKCISEFNLNFDIL